MTLAPSAARSPPPRRTVAADHASTKPHGINPACRSRRPAPAAARPEESGRPNPAAHLTPEQIEGIGHELDALRKEVMDSRGARDAAYIRKVITVQRYLEMSSRAVLLFSTSRSRACARPGGSARPGCRWPRSSRTWRSATTSCTASGTGCVTRRSTRPRGSGTTPAPSSSGSTATTRSTTPSPTSSAATTTSATASCGSTRTSAGACSTFPADLARRQRPALRVLHRGLRPRARRLPRQEEPDERGGEGQVPRRRQGGRRKIKRQATKRLRRAPAAVAAPVGPAPP